MPPGSMMDLINRAADPGYFQAVGIPLIKGRWLALLDGVGYDDKHPRMGSVLISQSAKRQFFKGLDPINQVLQIGTDAGLGPDPSGNPYPEYRIVGVVGDVPVSEKSDLAFRFNSDKDWVTSKSKRKIRASFNSQGLALPE